MFKPTKRDLALAVHKTVADVIAPGLRVLFCGINPGLYTAAVGHHFARPGNRFWPALHAAGFTDRVLSPDEEHLLPALGVGITNVVARASAAAAELGSEELEAGGIILRQKVERWAPRALAILGIGAYRGAFGRPEAKMGIQGETIGDTALWVLPNPSGLNAHYSVAKIAAMMAELRAATL